MPKTNEYHIYIEPKNISETDKKEKKPVADKTRSDYDIEMEAMEKLFSFGAVKTSADTLITFGISQIDIRTGMNEYQQRVDTIYRTFSELGNAALTIGASFAINPIVGVITATTQAVSYSTEIARKFVNLNLSRTVEGVSLDMQAIRAGTLGRRNRRQ